MHTKMTKLPLKSKILFTYGQGCFGIFTICFYFKLVLIFLLLFVLFEIISVIDFLRSSSNFFPIKFFSLFF